MTKFKSLELVCGLCVRVYRAAVYRFICRYGFICGELVIETVEAGVAG